MRKSELTREKRRLLWEDDKNILLPKLTNKLLHRFIQPYFIFCIINLFLNFAYQNFVVFLKKETVFDVCLYFSTNVKGILYSRGTVTCMPNCSPLWFLTALFSACLIYNMIYRNISEFIKIICLVLCPILSYVFDVSGIVKLPWNIDSACMGVVYLEIGNQIKKRQMLEKFDAFSLNKKMFLCMILFIGGMVAAVLNPISVSFDDNSYGNIACLLIASISLGVVVFFIAYSMKKCENCIVHRLICYFGRHTIFFMAFDYFIGGIVKSTFEVICGGVEWYLLFAFKLLFLMLLLFCWRLFWNMNKFKVFNQMLKY